MGICWPHGYIIYREWIHTGACINLSVCVCLSVCLSSLRTLALNEASVKPLKNLSFFLIWNWLPQTEILCDRLIKFLGPIHLVPTLNKIYWGSPWGDKGIVIIPIVLQMHPAHRFKHSLTFEECGFSLAVAFSSKLRVGSKIRAWPCTKDFPTTYHSAQWLSAWGSLTKNCVHSTSWSLPSLSFHLFQGSKVTWVRFEFLSVKELTSTLWWRAARRHCKARREKQDLKTSIENRTMRIRSISCESLGVWGSTFWHIKGSVKYFLIGWRTSPLLPGIRINYRNIRHPKIKFHSKCATFSPLKWPLKTCAFTWAKEFHFLCKVSQLHHSWHLVGRVRWSLLWGLSKALQDG